MNTTFAERLKYAMEQANINQATLSTRINVPKSAISQYLSGKNMPSVERIKILAQATGVTFDFLMNDNNAVETLFINKISVKEAARCMRKSDQFIRVGLQRGIFPFGVAVPGIGRCWNYYINPVKFRDYVGEKQFNAFFGVTEINQEGVMTNGGSVIPTPAQST